MQNLENISCFSKCVDEKLPEYSKLNEHWLKLTNVDGEKLEFDGLFTKFVEIKKNNKTSMGNRFLIVTKPPISGHQKILNNPKKWRFFLERLNG